MRRVGQPRDVAAAALYWPHPRSSWVTGVVLRVDGGTTRPSFDHAGSSASAERPDRHLPTQRWEPRRG